MADGTTLKFDFAHLPGYPQADYAHVLKQQLRTVGIDLETRQMDTPTLAAHVFRDRSFDTAIISYCNEGEPQVGVRRQYHSARSRLPRS